MGGWRPCPSPGSSFYSPRSKSILPCSQGFAQWSQSLHPQGVWDQQWERPPVVVVQSLGGNQTDLGSNPSRCLLTVPSWAGCLTFEICSFPIFGVGWHWDPLRVLGISADKPRGTDTEGSLGCSPLHNLVRWALRSWPGPNVRGHLVQLACIFRGGPWGPERNMELPEVNMPGLGPDPGFLTCQLAKKKKNTSELLCHPSSKVL